MSSISLNPISAYTDAELAELRNNGNGHRPEPEPAPARKTHWTPAELLQTEFPPIRYIVDGIIAPGLTVLAGAPKLGKSWLVLEIAFAVSVGGAGCRSIQTRGSLSWTRGAGSQRHATRTITRK